MVKWSKWGRHIANPVFTLISIQNRDILFYVGLIGAILALIPAPFLAMALLGLMRKRANTSIPLIVFLVSSSYL